MDENPPKPGLYEKYFLERYGATSIAHGQKMGK